MSFKRIKYLRAEAQNVGMQGTSYNLGTSLLDPKSASNVTSLDELLNLIDLANGQELIFQYVFIRAEKNILEMAFVYDYNGGAYYYPVFTIRLGERADRGLIDTIFQAYNLNSSVVDSIIKFATDGDSSNDGYYKINSQGLIKIGEVKKKIYSTPTEAAKAILTDPTLNVEEVLSSLPLVELKQKKEEVI